MCVGKDHYLSLSLQVAIGVCAAKKLHMDDEVRGSLQTVQDNIIAIMTLGNAKRKGGNALHVAAHDGNLRMSSLAEKSLAGEASRLDESLNLHGFTQHGTSPVMVAVEAGELQVLFSPLFLDPETRCKPIPLNAFCNC